MNKGTFSSPRFSPRFSSRSSRCGGENSKLCCGGGKNLSNQMHYFKVAQPFATLKGPFSAESAIRNSSTIVYLSRLDEIYLLVHSKLRSSYFFTIKTIKSNISKRPRTWLPSYLLTDPDELVNIDMCMYFVQAERSRSSWKQ